MSSLDTFSVSVLGEISYFVAPVIGSMFGVQQALSSRTRDIVSRDLEITIRGAGVSPFEPVGIDRRTSQLFAEGVYTPAARGMFVKHGAFYGFMGGILTWGTTLLLGIAIQDRPLAVFDSPVPMLESLGSAGIVPALAAAAGCAVAYRTRHFNTAAAYRDGIALAAGIATVWSSLCAATS